MVTIRRLRGVLGTALIWAVAWFALAFPVFAMRLRDFGIADIALVARAWGLAGAGTGATFALLVLRFERRRTLDRFRPARAAVWGAVAGAGYAAMTIARFLIQIDRPIALVAASIVIGGLLGGTSAALSTVLARRSATMTREPSEAEIIAQAN